MSCYLWKATFYRVLNSKLQENLYYFIIFTNVAPKSIQTLWLRSKFTLTFNIFSFCLVFTNGFSCAVSFPIGGDSSTDKGTSSTKSWAYLRKISRKYSANLLHPEQMVSPTPRIISPWAISLISWANHGDRSTQIAS